MKLAEYLQANGELPVRFAERIGRSPATVSRILSGIQRPEWKTMKAIARATRGKVTANDFMDAGQ